MLKIKDGTPLDILEQYGFDASDDWMFFGDVGDRYDYEPTWELSICIDNHSEYGLEYNDKNVLHLGVSYIPNIVFDLITDGLIEKTEEI